MNRRQFVAVSATAASAGAQTPADSVTAELPDMLLRYFTRRFGNEVNRTGAVRGKLLQAAGPFPARTPLKPQTLKTTRRSGYRIENILFESRPEFFVNANLYVPAELTAPAPAIVMTRGHFDADRMTGDYQQICFDLVRAGSLVLSYDPIGQGERRQQWTRAGTEPGADFDSLFSTSLEHALIGNKLALLGESAAGWQAWDAMRAIDYLSTRPDVDAKRIGFADHSDNGAESSIICALDERIACAALHGPRFSHRWPPDKTTWIVFDDTQEYLHGAARLELDVRDIFAAVAPRPLLVLIEDRDSGFAAGPFEVTSADESDDWPKRLRLETVRWFARWFRTGAAVASETDVTPEVRSVLQVLNPGKSIYTLIRGKSAQVVRSSVAELRALIAPFAAHAEPPRILLSDSAGGLKQDRLQLPSEPGIWLPATLLHPAAANGKVVVYVTGDVTALDPPGGDNDDDKTPQDMTAQKLAAKGFTVLSVDVRGIGATAPRIPRRGFRVPYHHLMNRDMAFAAMAWSLDDNLFAMRVRDLLRAVEFAAGVGEVWLAGRDMGAQWAVFAAALDTRVKTVITQDGLASWRLLLEHDRYHQASSQFIWGGLAKFDLPQVTAMIAPRRATLIRPADHNRQVLREAEARSIYRDTGATLAFSGDIADAATF
jgi:cephalosporin-C deacetylase-like acetyl esterase